jgi:hypothetical protein
MVKWFIVFVSLHPFGIAGAPQPIINDGSMYFDERSYDTARDCYKAGQAMYPPTKNQTVGCIAVEYDATINAWGSYVEFSKDTP